jgi:cell division protein ZipA
MQTSFILSISIIFLTVAIYFFYAQRQTRRNQSLREISKYTEWVEPILETALNEPRDENILEEITAPIIPPKKRSKSSRIRQAPTHNHAYATLSLYIMAYNNRLFQSYELLQAISVNGFHYGAMQIFHYHENQSDLQSPILFSLANAVEPGFFDLSTMGSFSCPGLTLFMRLDKSDNLSDRFYLMLETAKQLADDLGGEVLDETRKRFDSASESEYCKRLLPIK